MLKSLLLPTLLLFASSAVRSQTDTLFRAVDNNYEDVKDPRFADHETVSLFTHNSDQDWFLADYDLKTGKILARRHYLDSLRKTVIGPYELFYPGGKRKTQGTYLEGQKFGLWRSWYESGQIMDSAMYGEAGKTTGIRLKWYETGHLSDSIYYDADGPGKGKAISWYDNGTIYGQGPMLNGTGNGAWKFYRPDGTLSTEETLLKDSAISVRCFNPDGTVSTRDCFAEKDAEFPGGTQKWTAYISKKLQNHADYIIKKGGSGICVVLFVIDTNGKVVDARVSMPSGTYLDKEALEVINGSPSWIPAIQHNRPVKAYRRQPINFTVD